MPSLSVQVIVTDIEMSNRSAFALRFRAGSRLPPDHAEKPAEAGA
jgi:hypothetical protein